MKETLEPASGFISLVRRGYLVFVVLVVSFSEVMVQVRSQMTEKKIFQFMFSKESSLNVHFAIYLTWRLDGNRRNSCPKEIV